MRFAIYGTGGVGGYFGGRLAQAGEDVTFIARGEHLQAIQANGLQVESVRGDFVIHPAQATDDPAQVGPVDVVILGVKTWQVREAAETMRPLIGANSFVLPLQNGVEAAEQLSAVLGRAHIVGGLAKILSFIAAPGCIRHVGGPASITFGELDNRPGERLKQLRTRLADAGITAEIAPDIQAALWEKLLLIASFGGLGAITRTPIGVFRSLPQTRALLEQAMREALAVAQAHLIMLDEAAISRALAFVDSQPPHGTASMQRDIMEKRPSELKT